MAKLNIIVACGSGVATSTLATNEVISVCTDYGITDYGITKCSMNELPTLVDQANIVLTTSNYKGELSKPHMGLMGFITGIGEDALRKKLGEKLLEIQAGL